MAYNYKLEYSNLIEIIVEKSQCVVESLGPFKCHKPDLLVCWRTANTSIPPPYIKGFICNDLNLYKFHKVISLEGTSIPVECSMDAIS